MTTTLTRSPLVDRHWRPRATWRTDEQDMRILHLAKYYWPRSGGMERVVQGLAEGAAALGHDVEVVAVRTVAGSRDAGRQRSSVTRAFSFAALGSQELAPGYIAAAWKR